MNGAYLARGLAWMHDGCHVEPAEAPAAEPPGFDDAGAEFPALELLGDRVGMSRFERLGVAGRVRNAPIDHGVAVRRGQRQPGRRTYPTLALRPLDPAGASWPSCRTSGHCGTGRWSSSTTRGGPSPDRPRALRIDERIGRSSSRGSTSSMTAGGEAARPGARGAPPSHEATMRQIVTALTEEPGGPTGHGGLARWFVRRGLACARGGTRALRAHPRTPGRRSHWMTLLWERETLLLPSCSTWTWRKLVARHDHLLEDLRGRLLVGCREPWLRRRQAVDVARPTAKEQEDLGRRAGQRQQHASPPPQFDLDSSW